MILTIIRRAIAEFIRQIAIVFPRLLAQACEDQPLVMTAAALAATAFAVLVLLAGVSAE